MNIMLILNWCPLFSPFGEGVLLLLKASQHMRGNEAVMSPKNFDDEVMVNSAILCGPILKTNDTI